MALEKEIDHLLYHELGGLDYSIRRYFIDRFFFQEIPQLTPGSRILDVGGNKTQKRGLFNIGEYDLQVIYTNLTIIKYPEFQSDAASLPLLQQSVGGVICAELLEHVIDPVAVIIEAFRVMKRGGRLFITVPFLYQIHADPSDYGRYTNQYWEEILVEAGFSEISISQQGFFFCTVVDLIRAHLVNKMRSMRWGRSFSRKLMGPILGMIKKRAVVLDSRNRPPRDTFDRSFTTGFGIVCRKP